MSGTTARDDRQIQEARPSHEGCPVLQDRQGRNFDDLASEILEILKAWRLR